jgi:hypothetical protein
VFVNVNHYIASTTHLIVASHVGTSRYEIRQILTQMMLVDHDHDWKFPNSFNLLPDWVSNGLELFHLQVE